MGNIVNEHGRKLEEEKPAEESKGNGQSGRSFEDVRAIPTGTLIYNLGKFVYQEESAEGFIGQMEMMKKQQKMVTDPPPLVAARAQYHAIVNMRFICAREINERFRALDEAHAAAHGLKLRESDVVGEAVDGGEKQEPEPPVEPPKEQN